MPYADPAQENKKKRRWRERNKKRQSEMSADWKRRNPDRAKAGARRVYEVRKARLREQGLTTSGTVPKVRGLPATERSVRKRIRNRRRQANELAAALALLGGRCNTIDQLGCAGSDVEVLEIDHIRGDGYIERKNRTRGNGRRGGLLLTEYRRHGLDWVRAKYQLLCSNCHARKTKREAVMRRSEQVAQILSSQQTLDFS